MKKISKLFAALICAGILAGGNGVMAQDRMADSEAAIQGMFGKNNPVTVKGDAEITGIMQKFIYSDAAAKSNLPASQRELLTIIVLAVNGTPEDVALHVQGALKAGATPEEVKETLFQCTPYIGFAKAKPALNAMMEGFKKAGVKLPVADGATVTDADRMEKGRAVQSDIFGKEHIDAMWDNSPADQLFTAEFLSANCFGDFYTRKVLDVKQRELVTFTAIAAMGGCEPQLRSHVNANISVGNTRQDMLNALAAILPYIGYPRSLNALACINAIVPAK